MTDHTVTVWGMGGRPMTPQLTVPDLDAVLAVLRVRDSRTPGHTTGLIARVQAHRDDLHARTPHPASTREDD